MPRTITSRAGKRVAVLAMLGLAAVSATTGAFSLAVFTDTDTVAANAFTTGTIALTTSPTSAVVSYTTMMPGDSATGTLTVSNSGTGALRYAMTTSATNTDAKALRDQMTLEVRLKAAGTCAADFTGTVVVASGPLSGAAIGSVTAGAQTGDRALAAGATETLCFRAVLPSSTGNAFQGAATTATFTFESEQTASNP